MKTEHRICVKDWEITAENGDHFEVKKGRKYRTTPDRDNGTCVVFGQFWVPVPVEHFCRSIESILAQRG